MLTIFVEEINCIKEQKLLFESTTLDLVFGLGKKRFPGPQNVSSFWYTLLIEESFALPSIYYGIQGFLPLPNCSSQFYKHVFRTFLVFTHFHMFIYYIRLKNERNT